MLKIKKLKKQKKKRQKHIKNFLKWRPPAYRYIVASFYFRDYQNLSCIREPKKILEEMLSMHLSKKCLDLEHVTKSLLKAVERQKTLDDEKLESDFTLKHFDNKNFEEKDLVQLYRNFRI